MAAGVKVTGVESLTAKLQSIAKKHKPRSEVNILYGGGNVDYATIVHEDLEAVHPNGGSAKYLEQATRTTANQTAAIVRRELSAGKSMEQALLAGAQPPFEESQKLVPVDSGDLKASGRIELR